MHCHLNLCINTTYVAIYKLVTHIKLSEKMSKMRKTFKLLNFHRVTVHLQGAIQLDNIEMVFIICFVRFIILINSLISMHPNFDHPIICSKNWSTVKL